MQVQFCMPSVVFAEASWYGSLRGGVEVGGGTDGKFFDGGSRWGIKGSSEVSEGLSAVYRFEHKISTANASQPGGRLAYVGLSGGFGSISVGQVWSASFNSVGAITDNSNYYGNSETSYRVPSAVSYSLSAGNASFQVDAIMDPSRDTGAAIDQMEFGLSLSLMEGAKFAFAYVDSKDTKMMVTEQVFDAGTPPTVTVEPGTAGTAPTVTVEPGTASTPATVTVVNGKANTPATVVNEDKDATPPVTGADAFVLTLNEAKTAFSIGVDADGEETTKWAIDNGTKFTTSQLNAGSIMHSRIVDTSSGDNADTVAGTVKKLSVRPVIVILPSSGDNTTALPTGTSGGDSDVTQVASNFATTASGAIRHTACDTEGVACANIGAVFVAEYFHPTNTSPGDDGIVRADKMYSFVAGGNTGVTHTAEVEVFKSVTQGTAGTPTEVTVVAGKAGTPTTVTTTDGTAGTPATVTVEPGTAPTLTDVEDMKITAGSRDTHMALEYAVGGITAYLGYSQSKANGSSSKSKTTHFGLRGGLGDTGMSFRAMFRNKKNVGSANTNPWLVGVSRSLGGGAAVHFEHGNADDGTSGKTRVGLHVGF